MNFMDKKTYMSLDFQYIVDRIHTISPYGQSFKRNMKAYIPGQEKELKYELDQVERFVYLIEKEESVESIRDILRSIKDIRNSLKRLQKGEILTEVEIFEIKNFVLSIRNLKLILDKIEKSIAKDYTIEPLEEIERLLDPESTSIPTFYLYDAYSERLKQIRHKIRLIQMEIKKEKDFLKKRIREELKLNVNYDGKILVSKDKEELIEKLKDHPCITYLSEDYMTIKYALKPTYKMDLLNREMESLKEQEQKEEELIKEWISKEIEKYQEVMWMNIAGVGRLDFMMAKAELALEMKGTKPKITTHHLLNIKEGRHPKVEEILKDKGLKFKPISVNLKDGVTCITGANMGGKTVSLKLIGLLTAMAQHGLWVPAEEMTLGLNNFIRTSMEDSQSMVKGLSAFGGEIRAVQQAIELSDSRGLILIDELAKTTNPQEGYAISKALVEYLLDRCSITLITTHYDNIANKEGVVHLQVVGLSHANFQELEYQLTHSKADVMELINSHMDYGLVEVDKDVQVPKDAINIARILGLDSKIIELAEKNLKGKVGYIGKAKSGSKAH